MEQAIAALAPELGVTIGARVDVGAGSRRAPRRVRRDRRLQLMPKATGKAHPRPGRLAPEAASSSARPATDGRGNSALLALAARVPCVWAGNFSVGVVTSSSPSSAAPPPPLGAGATALEVVEMHHRFQEGRADGTPRASWKSSSRSASSAPTPSAPPSAGKASPASAPRRKSASTRCAAATSSATTPSSSPAWARARNCPGDRSADLCPQRPAAPPGGWWARSPGVYRHAGYVLGLK